MPTSVSSAPSSRLPSAPPPPPSPLPSFPSLRRRDLLLLSASPLPLALCPASAPARGLFRMPPPGLANRYFLVRAGESVYEGQGLLRTNPVAKTSVDNGLSPAGLRQAARAALELRRLGACEDDCWIWPSITQRAYQAAEIIAAANSINRSKIVPEYSFLDARGLGAYEGKRLEALPEVYASDNISPDIKPPPTSDGTPNESVADVFVRVTQLMSILETQYSGDTVVIVSPDSDNLSILQAGLIGLDLRRYTLAASVMAFTYSGFQLVAEVHYLVTGRRIIGSPWGNYFSLAMDQILAYLLLSASSAALSRSDVWVSRFGVDQFAKLINSSASMAFLAFIALGLSSIISAHRVFSSVS